MKGQHPLLVELLDASLIFHDCRRHNHYPTAASVCGNGLKIVWTSKVASTGQRSERLHRTQDRVSLKQAKSSFQTALGSMMTAIKKSAAQGEMSRRLYVGNLPYETGETELQELFGQVGSVDTVRCRQANWRRIPATIRGV